MNETVNEIVLGDVTVTRIEETHGPIMPADQFFPTSPKSFGTSSARTWCPTTSAPTTR